ncbi:hypothetical protein NLJ89_g4350 [Agrocybe chaxingu]|uniref:Uncharacterized protein n=1 Tax=Agrocybe chaxingu TaxID=84603 RepID=A0A9W8K8V2_9AGAR|nr:hypothetical protein NLJ89_g4350 [Agrocybe chaxingu]
MKLEQYQGVYQGMEKRQRPSDLPVSGRPCFWPGCPGVSSWGPTLRNADVGAIFFHLRTFCVDTTDDSRWGSCYDYDDRNILVINAIQLFTHRSVLPANLSLGCFFCSLSASAYGVVDSRINPPPENEKIEAFNVDAKWRHNPDFVINITAPPNEHGIQPYPYIHPTSAGTTTTLSSSKISEKKKYGLRASSGTAASAISSSSSSSYPSTMSYEEQQRMMEQLNALQMHLRQVEAQVRNVNENQVGAGEQEPPPMYVVALDGEGRPETPRRREKM